MHKSNLQRLGRLIMQQRNQRDFSLRDVEKCTGIPSSTLSRIERGETEKPPHPTYLNRIAQALDARVSEYYALAGYSSPQPALELKQLLQARHGLTATQAEQVEAIVQSMERERGAPN